MTAVLVLTIVIITLLIKRTPEPTQLVRVVPDGPTTTLTAFQSTDDCRNSDVLSPKGRGCTEDAAKADFMSKAKTKCDTECAKNTWDEKDCVRFGYVADVQCRSVIGTDCEGGTGFECRVPGAVLVERARIILIIVLYRYTVSESGVGPNLTDSKFPRC